MQLKRLKLEWKAQHSLELLRENPNPEDDTALFAQLQHVEKISGWPENGLVLPRGRLPNGLKRCDVPYGKLPNAIYKHPNMFVLHIVWKGNWYWREDDKYVINFLATDGKCLHKSLQFDYGQLEGQPNNPSMYSSVFRTEQVRDKQYNSLMCFGTAQQGLMMFAENFLFTPAICMLIEEFLWDLETTHESI